MPTRLRTPDLSDLRSLVEAADSGTLGRAALRLHISQPALTKRLNNLEQLVGTPLLERSQRGVKLTAAGRRLYEHARPLLAQAEAIDALIVHLRHDVAPVRLTASHSAAEAFVRTALMDHARDERELAVELVAANSIVVRSMVGERRADLGVCAARPHGTPNPGLVTEPLCEDEIVCGVPRGHPWAHRQAITRKDFLRTPMVVRDPSSNARWTVDTALQREGLEMAAPLAQAATPAVAREQALARNAPVLLSRYVLGEFFVAIPVTGLRFLRTYELVLPADAPPDTATQALAERFRSAVPVERQPQPMTERTLR